MRMVDRIETSVTALSREVGCGRVHLSMVLNGHLHPSPSLAKRIESATEGRIRAWELLGLQDGPPPALPQGGKAA